MPAVRPTRVRTDSPSPGTATRWVVSTSTATAPARLPPLNTTFTGVAAADQRAQDRRDHRDHEGPRTGQDEDVHDAGRLEERELLGLLAVPDTDRDPVAGERQRETQAHQRGAVRPPQSGVRRQRCHGVGVAHEQQRHDLRRETQRRDGRDEPSEPSRHRHPPFPEHCHADVPLVGYEEDIGRFRLICRTFGAGTYSQLSVLHWRADHCRALHWRADQSSAVQLSSLHWRALHWRADHCRALHWRAVQSLSAH